MPRIIRGEGQANRHDAHPFGESTVNLSFVIVLEPPHTEIAVQTVNECRPFEIVVAHFWFLNTGIGFMLF